MRPSASSVALMTRHTAEHPVTAETRGEPINMRHAIDDRQNRCFRTDRRCELLHGLIKRIRFHGKQNEVERIANGIRQNRTRGLGKIAVWADDAQSVTRQLGRSSRTHHERDIATSPDETSAEISAECTCSDH